MAERVLTTHVGSLPRPEDLVAENRARASGNGMDDEQYARRLADAVVEVVARQRELGLDLVNDGEYGHSMGTRYDAGAWMYYSYGRLSGMQAVPISELSLPPVTTRPGEVELAPFFRRRDFELFDEAYADPASGCAVPNFPNTLQVCRGPIRYVGQEQVARDIEDFAAALDAAGISDGYMNAVAPASCCNFIDEHYADSEERLYAVADAMREEYVAIVDAGLTLQLDDPAIADNWDQINPAPSIEGYRRYLKVRVDALNHAIRGLPAERIRFHLCWGSWHGPHTTDIPMSDVVDLMLQVNAGAYSFEAANARHEHEWTVWQDTSLPDGKILMPGVVSHSTNVVEHPDLVAQRIRRFTDLVGAGNVIASTDCGLGGRVHPQIAWAKLRSLAEGAAQVNRRQPIHSGS